MTLAELITGFREIAFDKKNPPLFSDQLLTIYANEAQVEAARRARLLLDSTTASAPYPTPDADPRPLCVFPITAGTRSITLDPRTIFVRRVKVASRALPIPKIRREDLDFAHPDWEIAEPADVMAYMQNYQRGMLFFDCPFYVDDTVTLTLVREPLYPMSSDIDPEINPRYQFKLIDWMLYRGLNNRDVEETYDPQGAKEHLAIFEGEFGTQVSARDDLWLQERHGYDDFEGVF